MIVLIAADPVDGRRHLLHHPELREAHIVTKPSDVLGITITGPVHYTPQAGINPLFFRTDCAVHARLDTRKDPTQ